MRNGQEDRYNGNDRRPTNGPEYLFAVTLLELIRPPATLNQSNTRLTVMADACLLTYALYCRCNYM